MTLLIANQALKTCAMKRTRHDARRLRDELGLSQGQVADTAGVTRETVSNFERGAKNTHGANVARIWRALDAMAREKRPEDPEPTDYSAHRAFAREMLEQVPDGQLRGLIQVLMDLTGGVRPDADGAEMMDPPRSHPQESESGEQRPTRRGS